MSHGGPTVLVIDDQPEQLSGMRQAIRARAQVLVRSPNDVTELDIRRASLFLIDFKLAEWPERDDLGIPGLQPLNGLALAAILRAQAERLQPSQPKAFALHSGHLADLAGGLPPLPREQQIARAHNIEWAFVKGAGDRGRRVASQCATLARAVASLPTNWPDAPRSKRTASDLLGLKAASTWYDEAWREIERCHPPLSELSLATHGLAFLRWLLHRVLPYPCFLWNADRLGLRLRVSGSEVRRRLRPRTALWTEMLPFLYTGILAEFEGPLFWGAGIEGYLWTHTNGASFDRDAVEQVVRKRLKMRDVIKTANPVLTLDRDYQVLSEAVDATEAVRIQPDDWPPFAGQAWTRLTLASDDPSLRALVVPEDLERLDSHSAGARAQ